MQLRAVRPLVRLARQWRFARLHLLTQQSRFLPLPSVGRTPQLASRVLGLNLQRLPEV